MQKKCERCGLLADRLLYVYGQRVCEICANVIRWERLAELEARFSGQA